MLRENITSTSDLTIIKFTNFEISGWNSLLVLMRVPEFE